MPHLDTSTLAGYSAGPMDASLPRPIHPNCRGVVVAAVLLLAPNLYAAQTIQLTYERVGAGDCMP